MTTIDEIMAQANRYALRNAQYCAAHITNTDLVSGEVAALRHLIAHAISEARADGAREMREFAAQESRWGGDSGCDADAMTAYIRALPLPTKREPVRLTDAEAEAQITRTWGGPSIAPQSALAFAHAIETAVLAANGLEAK